MKARPRGRLRCSAKLGVKELAALIVRKGGKAMYKGKKEQWVLQVGVLWAD